MDPGENRTSSNEGEKRDRNDRAPLWMRLFPVVSIGSYLAVVALLLSLIPTPQASGPRRMESSYVPTDAPDGQLAGLDTELGASEGLTTDDADSDSAGQDAAIATALARAVEIERAQKTESDLDLAGGLIPDISDDPVAGRKALIQQQNERDAKGRSVPPGIAKALAAAKLRREEARAQSKAGARPDDAEADSQLPGAGPTGAPARDADRATAPTQPPRPQRKISNASAAARKKQCDLSRWSSMGNLIESIEGNAVSVKPDSWNSMPSSAQEQLAKWMLRCVEKGASVKIVSSDSGAQIASYDAKSGLRSVE